MFIMRWLNVSFPTQDTFFPVLLWIKDGFCRRLFYVFMSIFPNFFRFGVINELCVIGICIFEFFHAVLPLHFVFLSCQSTSWPSRPTPTGRRCCSAVWPNLDTLWASSAGVSVWKQPLGLLIHTRLPWRMFSNNKQKALKMKPSSSLVRNICKHIFVCVSLWRWIDCSLITTLGNAQTLKQEPKRKKINVYKRLRAFWKKHYSAHYMTLAVQSKGQENMSHFLYVRTEGVN